MCQVLLRSRDMGNRHNGCVRFCCAVAIWATDTMDVSGFVAQSRYGQPTQWMCQVLLRSCDMGNRHNGCVRFCCAVTIWAADTENVSGLVALLRYGQPIQRMCQGLLLCCGSCTMMSHLSVTRFAFGVFPLLV